MKDISAVAASTNQGTIDGIAGFDQSVIVPPASSRQPVSGQGRATCHDVACRCSSVRQVDTKTVLAAVGFPASTRPTASANNGNDIPAAARNGARSRHCCLNATTQYGFQVALLPQDPETDNGDPNPIKDGRRCHFPRGFAAARARSSSPSAQFSQAAGILCCHRPARARLPQG